MIRFGIDLGGTKIEIIALNQNGEQLYRERVPTPQGKYHATLNRICELVKMAEEQFGHGSVGLGTPGTVTKSGLIKNSNSVCLIGKPLKLDIEQQLQREVRIENDANCFVVSEASDGNATGVDSVFGIIVGTGTGAGIVINKKLVEGCNGIAGEWGHNPLPWPTVKELTNMRKCYCGKRGCIETYLSGPGMSADHLQHYGRNLTPQKIMDGVRMSSKECLATLSRYRHRFIRSLAHVINLLDPQVCVLGGGMSAFLQLDKNDLSLLSEYVFSDTVQSKIVMAKHGDSSGVRGAAWLWDF